MKPRGSLGTGAGLLLRQPRCLRPHAGARADISTSGRAPLQLERVRNFIRPRKGRARGKEGEGGVQRDFSEAKPLPFAIVMLTVWNIPLAPPSRLCLSADLVSSRVGGWGTRVAMMWFIFTSLVVFHVEVLSTPIVAFFFIFRM